MDSIIHWIKLYPVTMKLVLLITLTTLWIVITGADPGFFLGGGALVSSNKPHSFFCRIPVVLENRRSSQGGGGAHPLDPPPRSAPG